MSQDLQIRAEDWERNWALASTDERIRALTDLLVAVRDEALEEAEKSLEELREMYEIPSPPRIAVGECMAIVRDLRSEP